MVNKLVFFDYDGTLVDERDHIYEPTLKTRESIKKLQANHTLCFLATGRALSYLPPTIQSLHLDGFITCNGAVITLNDSIIYGQYFSPSQIEAQIHYGEQHGLNFFLEGNQKVYVKDLKEKEFLHFVDYFQMDMNWFTDLNQYPNDQISKITFLAHNQEDVIKHGTLLSKDYMISYHRGCFSFDISQKHLSKGTAIDYLKEHFHLDKEDCISFGDGDNDYALIKHAGYGIVMKKHHPSLDEVAYDQTDSVLEEGITKALLRYGWIKGGNLSNSKSG